MKCPCKERPKKKKKTSTKTSFVKVFASWFATSHFSSCPPSPSLSADVCRVLARRAWLFAVDHQRLVNLHCSLSRLVWGHPGSHDVWGGMSWCWRDFSLTHSGTEPHHTALLWALWAVGDMLSSAVFVRDPSPAACCPAVAVDVSAFILHLRALYVFCFFSLTYGRTSTCFTTLSLFSTLENTVCAFCPWSWRTKVEEPVLSLPFDAIEV